MADRGSTGGSSSKRLWLPTRRLRAEPEGRQLRQQEEPRQTSLSPAANSSTTQGRLTGDRQVILRKS
jgi:hypothetical protein